MGIIYKYQTGNKIQSNYTTEQAEAFKLAHMKALKEADKKESLKRLAEQNNSLYKKAISDAQQELEPRHTQEQDKINTNEQFKSNLKIPQQIKPVDIITKPMYIHGVGNITPQQNDSTRATFKDMELLKSLFSDTTSQLLQKKPSIDNTAPQAGFTPEQAALHQRASIDAMKKANKK